MTEAEPLLKSDDESTSLLRMNTLQSYRRYDGSGQSIKNDTTPQRIVSDTRTLFNLLNGMLGPGLLSLPLAFKYAGLWAGLALTSMIGLLNIHCMGMLIKSAQYLCKEYSKSHLDYGNLAAEACNHGPKSLQKHSRKALFATNAIVAIYQLGVGSVSIVFLGANSQKLQRHWFPDVNISVRQYQAMWLLPVILACFARNLKHMAIISLIVTIIMLTCLIAIVQYVVRLPNMYEEVDYWFMSFQRFMLCISAVLYSFEGQAMLLPLENEMESPRDMIRPMGVLQSGMGVVIICYVTCGFYGYLKFGEAVEGSITLNMPPDLIYIIVNLLLVLAVFLGIPIQLYVIFAMIWSDLAFQLPYSITSSRQKIWMAEMLFRTGVVLIAFGLAISIPNLSDIIPLIGATAGCLIAFVLPSTINTITMWTEWKTEDGRTRRWLHITKNGLIASFGIFGLIAGLYANIFQLINKT